MQNIIFTSLEVILINYHDDFNFSKDKFWVMLFLLLVKSFLILKTKVISLASKNRGVYFLKLWYFCAAPFYPKLYFLPQVQWTFPLFPPLFHYFPFKFTFFLYESSYFPPNQSITHPIHPCLKRAEIRLNGFWGTRSSVGLC